jgi:hypothetical protein
VILRSYKPETCRELFPGVLKTDVLIIFPAVTLHKTTRMTQQLMSVKEGKTVTVIEMAVAQNDQVGFFNF